MDLVQGQDWSSPPVCQSLCPAAEDFVTAALQLMETGGLLNMKTLVEDAQCYILNQF